MARKFQFPLGDDKNKAQIQFSTWQQIPPEFDTSVAEKALSTDNQNAGTETSLPDGNKQAAELAGKLVSGAREIPTGESCLLYLPPSIQIADGVNLENVDLNVFGAGLEKGLSAGTGGVGDAIASGLNAGISSLTDAFKGNLNSDVARAAASRVAGGFGGATAGAVSSALKTTPNPNTRAIFKSVNLREFTFDFRMLPKTYQEAEEIRRIVHFFRRNLYPQTINMAGTDIPIAYKFPNKFQVNVLYNGKEISNDIKFEKMYIRNINTNYNPSQQSFYKGGHFQETNLTVSFIESRALTYYDIVHRAEWNQDELNSTAF